MLSSPSSLVGKHGLHRGLFYISVSHHKSGFESSLLYRGSQETLLLYHYSDVWHLMEPDIPVRNVLDSFLSCTWRENLNSLINNLICNPFWFIECNATWNTSACL